MVWSLSLQNLLRETCDLLQLSSRAFPGRDLTLDPFKLKSQRLGQNWRANESGHVDAFFVNNQTLQFGGGWSKLNFFHPWIPPKLASRVSRTLVSNFWAADRPSRSCSKSSSGWIERCAAICSIENSEDIHIIYIVNCNIYHCHIISMVHSEGSKSVSMWITIDMRSFVRGCPYWYNDKHSVSVCRWGSPGLASTDDGSRFDGKPTSGDTPPWCFLVILLVDGGSHVGSR